MFKPNITVAISIGDPAGIGPEVTLKSLIDNNINRLAKFIVVGDRCLRKRFKANFKNVEFLDLKIIKKVKYGVVSKEYGFASLSYIKRAVELIKDNIADCLVTAPVNKESINKTGIKFSGHTEILAEMTNTKNFLMMLVSDKLRISLVTRHVPLSMVTKSITIEKIINTIKLTNEGLIRYFSIQRPVIAVAGVNPHASDGGYIGDEESRIVIPAIKKSGIKNCLGPYAADTLFYKKKFDCFIAMYHDQGLIPVKQNGVNNVVNLTIGLPFVRTSPAHGSGFDIAGKNIADSQSMKNAILLALNCYKNLKQ